MLYSTCTKCGSTFFNPSDSMNNGGYLCKKCSPKIEKPKAKKKNKPRKIVVPDTDDAVSVTNDGKKIKVEIHYPFKTGSEGIKPRSD